MRLPGDPVACAAAIPSCSEETLPEPTPAPRPPSTPLSSPADSRMSGWRQPEAGEAGTTAFHRRGGVRRPDGRSLKTAGTLSSSTTPTAPTAPTAVPLKALAQTPTTQAAHYEQRDMPTDTASLDRLRDDALLASYPYHRDQMALPSGWAPAGDLATQLRRELTLTNRGVDAKPGAIVDRDSGLTAVLLRGHKTNEVVLVFGGTTAGRKTGATLAERSRPGRTFMSTLSQWGANLCAGLGGTPRSYRQAEALLAAVQRRLATDPALAGHTVRVLGHSKGGGEAMYAALKARAPVPVTAFCPAHLSDRLIRQLPEKNLASAKAWVRSFSPKGDPVAGLRGLLPGMHGVGIGHHFDGIPGSSAMNRHDQFHQHVLHHHAIATASNHRA